MVGKALWSIVVKLFRAVRAFSEPVSTVPIKHRARSYELRCTRDLRLAELRDHHGWLMATFMDVDRKDAVAVARTFLASRSDEQLLNPVFDRPLRA